MPIRAASPAMVTLAGSPIRSAAVAASQMQPMASTARTAVLSCASTLGHRERDQREASRGGGQEAVLARGPLRHY